MQYMLRLFVSKLSNLVMHVPTLALLCPLHVVFCHPKPFAILKVQSHLKINVRNNLCCLLNVSLSV